MSQEFKFSEHCNEKNIKLTEDEAERLLIEHIKEYDPQTYAQYLAILENKKGK